ncbi:hypothetical protein OQA88_4722 [Cercophora sp. LCS_1]
MASIASRPPPAVISIGCIYVGIGFIGSSVGVYHSDPPKDSDPPSDPPTVRFTNTQDLFDDIDSTPGDFLTVTNVSPDQFTEIERVREKRRRKFRFRRYDSNSQILIITIPTDLHEALHLGLYRRYCNQLVRNVQGHPGGNGGEGDSAGGPRPEREGKGNWPTLVNESGHSETLPELHKDMQWWFRASNHEVKIVILAKFDDQQHHILLEKWEEEISSPQGAITRSRAAAILQQNGVLNPVKRQSITITRDETTDPVSYNVTRGALVLGFRLLFLRNPGPQEGDFVFSIQDLQLFAAHHAGCASLIMSQHPYPYGGYGHFGPPAQQQQQPQPQQQSSYPGYPIPTSYPQPPYGYNPYAPITHPDATNSQAVSQNSFNYNANLIPGLHVGIPPPVMPAFSGTTFPSTAPGLAPNHQAPPSSSLIAPPSQNTWNAPKSSASKHPVTSSLASTKAQPPTDHDFEEGELSEGQFEDLYEPRGSDKAPIPSTRGPSPPTSAQDTPEGGFYGRDEDEGEIVTHGSKNPVSTTEARERSGSYSPFLSPREIQTGNTTPQVTGSGDNVVQPSSSVGKGKQAEPFETLSPQKMAGSAGTPLVPNETPTKTFVFASLQEARKEVQKAILQLLSMGVKFQDYIDEGYDEDLMRSLYSDLHLDIPKKDEELSNVSEQQTQPSGAVNTQPSKPTTTDSKAEERKDRIARLLAAKATKPPTSSHPEPATAEPKSAPTELPSQPNEQPIVPPAGPKPKAWGEKELLIQQKIAALQKSREAQSQKTATSTAASTPRSMSVNGAQGVTLPQQPAALNVEAAPAAPTPRGAVRLTQSSYQQGGDSQLDSIPGLSLPSSSQSAQRPTQRKRPVAADFVEYSNSVDPLKRPFGHERTESSLVIDVSDDSDEEMDMDEDMDTDMESPSEGHPPSTALPFARQGRSIRDFPPLSDNVPSRQFSSPAPLSHTSSGGLINGKRKEKELELKEKEREIEEFKRKIAEAEAKRKAKKPSVGSQTPAQATPEVKDNDPSQQQPRSRKEVANSPKPPSTQATSDNANSLPKRPALTLPGRVGKAERRDRIVSLELPRIDESLEHKVKKLAQMREESRRLESEINQELSKKRQLAEELEQIDTVPSESPSQQNSTDSSNSSGSDSRVGTTPSDQPVASAPEAPFFPDQSDSDSDVSMEEERSSRESSQADAPDEDSRPNLQSPAQQHPEADSAKIAPDEANPVPNNIGTPKSTDPVGDQQATSIPEPKTSDLAETALAPAPQSGANNMVTIPEPEKALSEANVDDTAPMELDSVHPSPAAHSRSAPTDASVDQSATDEESAEEEDQPGFYLDQMASTTQFREGAQDSDDGSLHEAIDAAPANAGGKFTPYESPLKCFKAFRYHPNFYDWVPEGLRSLTYMNRIDPNKVFCPHELWGRACPDGCTFQHLADITIPDDQILVELGSADDFTGEEKSRFIQGLREVLAEFRVNKVKDFHTIARGIVAYRTRFRGDKSKILNLEGVAL